MKGQHLFVRPATPDDTSLVQVLCSSAGYEARPATEVLIGKLAGSCVAALFFDFGRDDTIVLQDLFVAPELRKKRVGAGMLFELARLGRSLGKVKIVTRWDRCPFFDHVGFNPERGLLQKSIKEG